MWSMEEPTNAEILRSVNDVAGALETTRTELTHAIEGLRFDMAQQFGAVNSYLAALNRRLGALEDRVDMQGVTVRAIWDHLPGGDEHAA